MKKVILFYCIVFCIGPNAFSQKNWRPLSPDRIENWGVNVVYADSSYLYMAGLFTEVNGEHMQGIARWNGVKWDSLGAGINGQQYDLPNQYTMNIWTMINYQHKLYVGGDRFASLGKVNAYGLGSWDGTKWDSMPIQPFKCIYLRGEPFSSGAINDMDTINNKLYISGGFDTVAGFPCMGIASWDGVRWNSLNFPSNFAYFDGVGSICAYDGSIYAGGEFDATINNDTANNILRWDGINWHSVGGGIGNAWINCMVVYKGELYVAGYFSGVDNNIQKWDGTKWSAVGGGTDGEIFSLTVYNNKLYAMGEISMAGGIPANSIACWDGTKWCSLGSNFDNNIASACSYKDSLYIGGYFWTIDGDSTSYIAEWTGGNYVADCGTETGVGEVKESAQADEEVRVYPNPTNTNVIVQMNIPQQGNVQFILYNLLGEPVYSEMVNEPPGLINKQISLSGLPNGTYIIKAITKDNVYYTKITKLQ